MSFGYLKWKSKTDNRFLHSIIGFAILMNTTSIVYPFIYSERQSGPVLFGKHGAQWRANCWERPTGVGKYRVGGGRSIAMEIEKHSSVMKTQHYIILPTIIKCNVKRSRLYYISRSKKKSISGKLRRKCTMWVSALPAF